MEVTKIHIAKPEKLREEIISSEIAATQCRGKAKLRDNPKMEGF